MNTFVFDIETIPLDYDSLDERTQTYLMKFSETEEDRDQVKRRMALWAPTNVIVAIGVLSVESQKGAVYFQDNGAGISLYEKEGIVYRAGTEAEILEKFWTVMRSADRFVTFNGRGFDCPVLMLRSAMLHIRPTVNVMPYRYAADRHVDLLEQLTFYGATRKFNLDTYCRAFGIPSPKTSMNGHDVKPLFEKGAYQDIAEYCAGDIFATRELYTRWREYMYFDRGRYS
jgi:hypothetical protein